MPEITDQQLIDAATDAANFGLVVNGAATNPPVVMRSGIVVPSLAYVATTMAKGDQGTPGSPGILVRGPFNAANTYAPNNLVTFNGAVYLCIQATGGGGTPPTTTPSANLYDPSAVTADHYVNLSNGTLTAYTGAIASGFMDLLVPGGTGGVNASSWTTNNVIGFNVGASEGPAYYSAPNEASFVEAAPPPSTGTDTNTTPPTTIQNPNGHRYVRFNSVPTGAAISASQTMVVRGNALPSQFVPFGSTTTGGSGTAVDPSHTAYWTLFVAAQNPVNNSSGAQPLAGKTTNNWGDSISIIDGTNWQNAATAIHGATLANNYAQSGRHWFEMFTEFISNGVLNTANLGTALNSVNYNTIFLGTNDVLNQILPGSVPLGTATDAPMQYNIAQGTAIAYPSGITSCAYIRYNLRLFKQLAPTIPLAVYLPYHVDNLEGATMNAGDANFTTANPVIDAFNTQVAAICASLGIPCKPLAPSVGINSLTMCKADGTPILLKDKLHPTNPLGYAYVGSCIGNDMMQRFRGL